MLFFLRFEYLVLTFCVKFLRDFLDLCIKFNHCISFVSYCLNLTYISLYIQYIYQCFIYIYIAVAE